MYSSEYFNAPNFLCIYLIFFIYSGLGSRGAQIAGKNGQFM